MRTDEKLKEWKDELDILYGWKWDTTDGIDALKEKIAGIGADSYKKLSGLQKELETKKDLLEAIEDEIEKTANERDSEKAIDDGSANVHQDEEPEEESETFGKSNYHLGGCLPTAIAIAFNYSGKCTQYEKEDIGEVIESHEEKYLKKGGGARGEYIVEGLAHDFDFVSGVRTGYNVLVEHLKNGGVGLVQYDKGSYTGSGYYMAVVGIEADSNGEYLFHVIDPYEYNTNRQKNTPHLEADDWYTADEFRDRKDWDNDGNKENKAYNFYSIEFY